MTGEERVAFLEAQMEAQKQKSGDLSEQIRELDRTLEKRADGIDSEIKALGNRLDDHFKWLVGINVTMWAATVAAIFVSMSMLLARLS